MAGYKISELPRQTSLPDELETLFPIFSYNNLSYQIKVEDLVKNIVNHVKAGCEVTITKTENGITFS